MPKILLILKLFMWESVIDGLEESLIDGLWKSVIDGLEESVIDCETYIVRRTRARTSLRVAYSRVAESPSRESLTLAESPSRESLILAAASPS